MKIEQFEDKNLSHYSYAILSECENKIVLVDPSRNIQPYLAYAELHQAKITGVIETHPHADFVSGHLELHQTTGAAIYCSKLVGAAYPHQTFDEGDVINVGKIKLKAINTPGHSPDSISIILEHEGKDKAIFTGDTLFIGDCGRPDLREKAGNLTAKREELAGQMYHSLREKLMKLDNEVIVFPAHGAGTLCGKALSDASHSTIGAERMRNWSLQEMTEDKFIAELNADQPFVPAYFPFDVDVNKKGASSLETSLAKVAVGNPVINEETTDQLESNITIIDTRPSEQYKAHHLPNSVNLMNGGKFETWLGSIMAPEEPFYLLAKDDADLQILLNRAAKIGYEPFIKEALVMDYGTVSSDKFDLDYFRKHFADFTIIDVRNKKEHKDYPIFKDSVNIPLPELMERVREIPSHKPVAVHCASGYRSAAGSSIVADHFGGKTEVYDISDAIKEFDHS
jgi:glyoxylase-like metal-dependent hydrolase (beta-lactamase superfamily II)/rhodanese-related sulfurtransferase